MQQAIQKTTFLFVGN